MEVFVNNTLQPRVEDPLTRALRLEIQQEGTYRLKGRENCDILIKGTVIGYSRQGLSFDPRDPVQVRDYNLVLLTHIVAYERSTGTVLFDQDFTGDTQVRAGEDLTSAERQVMPLLANDLARKIVDLLADGTW